MIGQYLSNTNESATVSIFQKNLKLNKAKFVGRKYWVLLGMCKNICNEMKSLKGGSEAGRILVES